MQNRQPVRFQLAVARFYSVIRRKAMGVSWVAECGVILLMTGTPTIGKVIPGLRARNTLLTSDSSYDRETSSTVKSRICFQTTLSPQEAEPILGRLTSVRALQWPDTESASSNEPFESVSAEQVFEEWSELFPSVKIKVLPQVGIKWREATVPRPGPGSKLVDSLNAVAGNSKDLRWVIDDQDIVIMTSDNANRAGGILSSPETLRLCADLRSRTRIHWNDAQVKSVNGRGLTVELSGQIMIAPSPNALVPFCWPQTFRIALSRMAEVEPNWKDGLSEADTIWVDGVSSGSGAFSVTIPITAISRPLDESRRFRVAMSLSDLDPVDGNPSVDVFHLNCYEWIRIEPQAAVPIGLEWVHATPSLDPKSYDPAALVRANNRLQSLDADELLSLLNDYIYYTRSISGARIVPRIPNHSDTANPSSVSLLIRFMFAPKDANGQVPPIHGARIVPVSERVGLYDPAYPLVLIEDFPFLVARPLGRGTGPGLSSESVQKDLEWAVAACVLRAHKLRPPDDPTPLAERIEMLLGDIESVPEPRRQVWNALAPALNLTIQPSTKVQRSSANGRLVKYVVDKEISNEDWEGLLAAAARYGTRWDEVEQCYDTVR